MNIKILDGKSLAKATAESIAKQVNDLNNKGISPTLATILVGQDPASETYVKMKRNTCARVGMKSIAVEMSDSTTTEELLIKINELNDDDNVHGILYSIQFLIKSMKGFVLMLLISRKMLMGLPVLVLEICLWVYLLLDHVRQLEL